MSTLLNLRTRARRMADQVNSTFITDAELNDYINDGLGDLRELIMQHAPDLLVSATPKAITTVAGTSSYALATDHYKTYYVDLVDGSNTYIVQRASNRERTQYLNEYQYARNYLYPSFRFFQPSNDVIQLLPTPQAVFTVNVYYIPEMTLLSADGDTPEAGIEENWLRFVVLHAVVQMKLKAEESTGPFLSEKKDIEDRIETILRDRLISQSQFAADVSRDDWRSGY